MGYDPTTCYNSLKSQNLGPCPNDLGTASSYHCLDAQESGAIHAFCAKEGIYYEPFQYSEAYNVTKCRENEYNAVKCEEKVFATVSELAKYLRVHPDMDSRPCYCCCSCLAYGTPIAIPSGLKAIEKIIVGEEVMGGAVTSKGGKLSFSWTPAAVTFSQGTPPSDPKSGIASTMVFIYCHDDLGIISTEDQLFMTPAGVLKQANTLKPGDELVTVSGDAVAIMSIKIGNWYGGVHHITAGAPFTGDLNGHLISAGSFVVADFSVQLDPVALGKGFEAGPVIGSKEYEKANKSMMLRTGVYTHKNAKGNKDHLPKHFKLFNETPAYIPADAQSFITNKQAIDIVGNPEAHFRPYGNKTGIDSVKYLFQLYKAFYPDYNFYLDWENLTPNAYSFESYGVKTVVISGGLVRLQGLYIEGLAFILAHCVAHFVVLPPSVYQGPRPLPTIQADYYGVGLVMPTVWHFNAYSINGKAITQMEQFWGYISPENQKGDPAHPQEDPSIECRLTTMTYARLGGNLPPCAELPVKLLQLIGEQVGILVDKSPFVRLYFSDGLDEVTALPPANYAITPAVTISAVNVPVNNERSVQIVADFKAGVEYTVVVSGVKGSKGEGMDPKKNSIKFIGQ
ncbi:hypothetical protein [Chitinophaga arvensicola]|uniref:Uncharacterized protein n=1 Tax=Chitinophaga arvensicola TaxID=29529 RepID=A0A1I0S9F5_9BACT|nr:hypothetical protein [Chitinophaga arvensicola]SEW52792.1 hypothetical protein SAMN04488122_5119 [Chitinophaga arvensicola]